MELGGGGGRNCFMIWDLSDFFCTLRMPSKDFWWFYDLISKMSTGKQTPQVVVGGKCWDILKKPNKKNQLTTTTIHVKKLHMKII